MGKLRTFTLLRRLFSGSRQQEKRRGGIPAMSEDSLLERVTAAAEERHLSQNTLTAYRRTWLKLIAWSAAEGLVLETLPSERAGEFYERRLGVGALPITCKSRRPSRCSMMSWVPQIRSPSARLPSSRPRKRSCVITLPRNWDSFCASCARIAVATLDT
jgi:hypothetical protein